MSASTYAPSHPLITQTKDSIIEMIFAGHAIAKLLVKNNVCECGLLTGPAHEVESHVSPLCPVSRFYELTNEIAQVGR